MTLLSDLSSDPTSQNLAANCYLVWASPSYLSLFCACASATLLLNSLSSSSSISSCLGVRIVYVGVHLYHESWKHMITSESPARQAKGHIWLLYWHVSCPAKMADVKPKEVTLIEEILRSLPCNWVACPPEPPWASQSCCVLIQPSTSKREKQTDFASSVRLAFGQVAHPCWRSWTSFWQQALTSPLLFAFRWYPEIVSTQRE